MGESRAVIVDHLDDATRDVHTGVESRAARRSGTDDRRMARRTLALLGAAADIRDLAVPPGNRLERLRGDLSGYSSIRVNDQFRITSGFEGGNASNVHLVDSH